MLKNRSRELEWEIMERSKSELESEILTPIPQPWFERINFSQLAIDTATVSAICKQFGKTLSTLYSTMNVRTSSEGDKLHEVILY